jgi:hypothetical protein
MKIQLLLINIIVIIFSNCKIHKHNIIDNSIKFAYCEYLDSILKTDKSKLTKIAIKYWDKKTLYVDNSIDVSKMNKTFKDSIRPDNAQWLVFMKYKDSLEKNDFRVVGTWELHENHYWTRRNPPISYNNYIMDSIVCMNNLNRLILHKYYKLLSDSTGLDFDDRSPEIQTVKTAIENQSRLFIKTVDLTKCNLPFNK